MARDAKPSEIELKRDDFSTPKQEKAAERLIEHWDSNCEFKQLAEEEYPGDDEPSDSLYRKVYNEYFGPTGDRRTFDAIREQYGSVANYLEERKKGNVDLQFDDDRRELTDRELSLVQEGYKMARDQLEEQSDRQFDKGYEKGWTNALDMAERFGVDKVREMEDESLEEDSEQINLPFRE
jgi:hypothetical protein